MGRKKKEIKPETEKQTADGIKYTGNVKVSVANGKKIISSKTYHNTGCQPLFNFICRALAGDFNRDDRPCKIALFTDSSTTPITSDAFADNQKCSAFVLNDTKAVVNTIADQPTVTYHFRIPYAFITTNSEIAKVALFNANPSDSNIDQQIYAKYFFTDATGTSWDKISIPETTGNYSIIIEWTMKLTNN